MVRFAEPFEWLDRQLGTGVIAQPADYAPLLSGFTVLTVLGCLPWVFALGLLGREAGSNWEDWKDSLHYVDYTVAVLIVLGALYLVVRWRRNRNRGQAADAPA